MRGRPVVLGMTLPDYFCGFITVGVEFVLRRCAVMTLQGAGASLSPAIGGWLAQWLGYTFAFLILGSFAVGSVLIWCLFASDLRSACGAPASSCRGSYKL